MEVKSAQLPQGLIGDRAERAMGPLRPGAGSGHFLQGLCTQDVQQLAGRAVPTADIGWLLYHLSHVLKNRVDEG